MSVSFEAGMAVLEALAGSNHPQTIGQISSRIHFDHEVVHETLKILQTTRYISISDAPETVTLSPKLWSLGFCSKARADLKRAADHHLSELAISTGESACMAIIADMDIVIAAALNVPGPTGAEFEIGTKIPAHMCAAGKAILASQPVEMIAELEKSMLAAAPARNNPGALARELEAIRLRGYAVHRNELDGMTCEIAVPIGCVDGNIEAALGIAGSSSRLTGEVMPAMADHLLKTADRISRELKYLRAETQYGA